MARPSHRIWLDLLAIGILVPLVWMGVSDLPRGDHPHALFLFGADAGEWALNAQYVLDGDLASVDRHRGPPFVLAIALARLFTEDLAHAGHEVVVAAWALRSLVVYALGRMCGGPLVGVLGALLTTSLLPLYYSAAKYGVDPLVCTLLPLALAVVGPARRWPAWSWVAGAVVGFVMVSHFTALPYVLPAMLLLVLRGGMPDRPLSAWARPLLFTSGVAATLFVVHLTFGLVSVSELMHSVSEGVARDSAGAPGSAALSTTATATLMAGRHTAGTDATRALVLPYINDLTEWSLYIGLVWAGIVGLSLAPRAPKAPEQPPRRRPGQRRRTVLSPRHPISRVLQGTRWARTDLLTGLVLVSAVAPAPFFAAAEAPDRYTENLLPFVALLIARGLASAVHTVVRVVPQQGQPWVWGLLAVGVTVWVADISKTRLDIARQFVSAPGPEARAALVLSQRVDYLVPSDSAVATPIREAAAHLGRPYCPRRSCVPGTGTDAFEACVAHLRTSCQGTGPIPLVWVREGPVGMGDDAFSQAFGAWAAETYGTTGYATTTAMRASVITIPRTE